jgi:hypothetical protein
MPTPSRETAAGPWESSKSCGWSPHEDTFRRSGRPSFYLSLGDRQRSLQELENAYEARDPWLVGLKVDRVFDPLRSDPRFIELLRKVGLDK